MIDANEIRLTADVALDLSPLFQLVTEGLHYYPVHYCFDQKVNWMNQPNSFD